MKERFAGNTGQHLLLEALKEQKLIAGNIDLANEIVSVGGLLDVATGEAIIQQGNDDSDVYLILAGAFDVIVNDRIVASKSANDHVGEMVAIQPTRKRTASVIAREPSVVIKVSEPQFAKLSAKYPHMLLYIAKELARRLEQRNTRFMEQFGMV
jgi:CRP/FNR family cyclic AMP-dependent transcriptional regulator